MLDYRGTSAPARRLQLLQVLAGSNCTHNPAEEIVDALAARFIDASTGDVIADADWLAARSLVGISHSAGGTMTVLTLPAAGLEIALGLARHPEIGIARPGTDNGVLPGPGCESMADYHRWRTGEPLAPGRRHTLDLGAGATLSICPDRPLRPETLDALQEVGRAIVNALTRPAAPAAEPGAASAHPGAKEAS